MLLLLLLAYPAKYSIYLNLLFGHLEATRKTKLFDDPTKQRAKLYESVDVSLAYQILKFVPLFSFLWVLLYKIHFSSPVRHSYFPQTSYCLSMTEHFEFPIFLQSILSFFHLPRSNFESCHIVVHLSEETNTEPAKIVKSIELVFFLHGESHRRFGKMGIVLTDSHCHCPSYLELDGYIKVTINGNSRPLIWRFATRHRRFCPSFRSVVFTNAHCPTITSSSV